MEDVLIGRASAGESRQYTLDTATPVLIFTRNDKRFALWIPWPQHAVIYVSPYQPLFDATSGTGALYFGGLLLNLKDHGDLVRAPWYALADTAATVITVSESLFYPNKWPEEPTWQNGNPAYQPQDRPFPAPIGIR